MCCNCCNFCRVGILNIFTCMRNCPCRRRECYLVQRIPCPCGCYMNNEMVDEYYARQYGLLKQNEQPCCRGFGGCGGSTLGVNTDMLN